MSECQICAYSDISVLYHQKNIPVYQNVTFKSYIEAKEAPSSEVILSKCKRCNFIFNSKYIDSEIDYNKNYQNEQANSFVFQEHLSDVYEVIKHNIEMESNIIEIGCGKGFFLNYLKAKGYNITGFDPAYEGEDKSIVKDYFTTKYNLLGDLIILRHTLEHIKYPLEFLNSIAKSNNYKGKIYIEVPAFEWIEKNNAIEDIFYEHCNYFTKDTLSMIFKNSETGYLFGNQYLYLVSDFENLYKKEELKFELKNRTKYEIIDDQKYINILNTYKNIAIWGAGAKGSTFVNVYDPDSKYIKCVIDINKKKQGRFIAVSGHKIIPPNMISEYNIETIIVMNVNYMNEIEQEVKEMNLDLKIITL